MTRSRIALLALFVAALSAQPLRAEELPAPTDDDLIAHARIIGLGQLLISDTPAPEGQQRGTIVYSETLYVRGGGAIARSKVLLPSRDWKHRDLLWEDKQEGVWVEMADGPYAKYGPFFRPSSDRSAVVKLLQHCYEKSIDDGFAALRRGVAADPGGEKPATRQIARLLYETIDSQRTLPAVEIKTADSWQNAKREREIAARLTQNIQAIYKVYGITLDYPSDPQTDADWQQVIKLAMHVREFRLRNTKPVPGWEDVRRPVAAAVVVGLFQSFLKATVTADDDSYQDDFDELTGGNGDLPHPLPARAKRLAELVRLFESGKLDNIK